MKMKSQYFFLAAALILIAWPASADNSLAVTNACAMQGTDWGLEVTFDGSNTRAYVQDQSPDFESVYRASFDFDPNGITMANGDAHSFFTAWRDNVWAGGGSVPAFQLYLYNRGGKYVFRGIVSYNSDNKRLATGFLPITTHGQSRPVRITVEFTTASSPSVGDGTLSISIDILPGVKKSVNAKNSAMFVDWVNLGPFQSIDPTTVGSYCFDGFESYRTLEP